MTTLRNLLMGICAAVVLIAAVAYDAFPAQWNMALLIVAAASVGGVAVIAHAQRNGGGQ